LFVLIPPLEFIILCQGTFVFDPTFANAHGREVGLVASTVADFSAGITKQTGRPLDVSLSGEGMLAIQTSQGERYSRAGTLQINNAGQLVTISGDLVVGEKGPITLPKGDISISENGTISSAGQEIDKLKIVRFDNPTQVLYKEGQNLFASTEAPKADNSTKVVQNSLEMSNVDTLNEMAAMLRNSREFDSLQKSITVMMNDIGRKVSNELGRI
jgi:flagellar basal body rod protein FlgG